MTTAQKEELQKEFANYLRNTINQLPDTDLPKEFKETNLKITVATIRKYCSRVIQENKESEKVQRIKEFYDLRGNPKSSNISIESTEIDKFLVELEQNENKARAVANLFKGKTENPNEETLSFAAFLINLPFTSLEEFKKWKESNNYQTSQETEINNQTETKEQNDNITENQIIDTQITEETLKIADEITQIQPLKPTFWQQHKQSITIAASLILAVIFSTFSYQYYQTKREKDIAEQYINSQKDKLQYIEKVTFAPVSPDTGFVENDEKKERTTQKTSQAIDNQKLDVKTDKVMAFYTNSIYNGKFLYTTAQWSFETDETGEDMNSKYGEPYREQIKSLIKLPNNLPTIANKNIWIRFNVNNVSTKKLFIDNVKVQKIGTYPIDKKTIKWSNWITPKDGEKRFELQFTHDKQVFALTPFVEIAPESPQHFSLIINTEASCENYIYRFQLIVSANDGQGNRYTITSDKVYSLGRISEL